MTKRQIRRPSGPSRRKARLTSPWLTVLAIVVIVLLLAATFIGTATRTYLIEARTLGATVTFEGDTNAWQLDGAMLCTERSAPDLRDTTSGICPPAIFETSAPETRILDWPPDSRVALRLQPDDSLLIESLSGTAPAMPVGALLVVPKAQWQRHGALVVNGAIRFGGDMGSGAQDFLETGTWDARQTSLAAAYFRPTLEVVKSGNLTRGASAEIWRANGPATMFGHITPSFEGSAPGLIMSFLSEAGRVEMRVRYYGLDGYAVIRPDLLDTIRTSPILLAAIAVLTVLATVKDLLSLAGPKRKENRRGRQAVQLQRRLRRRKG